MDIQIDLSSWQHFALQLILRLRFTVISAGRQSGKTTLLVFVIVYMALKKANSINWWVAPTYAPTKIAFRRTVKFLVKNKIPHTVNRSELRIELQNGSTIEFKSGDREEGLRGESVNFLVIDEMGLLKRMAWEEALRGTITATEAKCVFIGTPKGKNLFYELFAKGQDVQEKEWTSIQVSSKESPYFSDSEWEEVKKMPARIFDQEYWAHFIEDGGEVFRRITDCVQGSLQDYNSRKQYFAGVDLAKHSDYTVICILDNNGHLVYFDRFNDITWTIQKARIIDACTKYHAYTLIDSTGIGDPILDDLSMHMQCEGYRFDNTSKRHLIETLSMSIERVDITFPEIPELINELNIFTFDQSQSGLIRYNAPDGLHDDIVISLSLANFIYKRQSGHSVDDFTDIGKRVVEDFYA